MNKFQTMSAAGHSSGGHSSGGHATSHAAAQHTATHLVVIGAHGGIHSGQQTIEQTVQYQPEPVEKLPDSIGLLFAVIIIFGLAAVILAVIKDTSK